MHIQSESYLPRPKSYSTWSKAARGIWRKFSKWVTHIICRNIWMFIHQFHSIANLRFSRCARIQISNDVVFDLFYGTVSLVLYLINYLIHRKKGQQLARELFYFLSTEKYLIHPLNSQTTRGMAITARRRRSSLIFWLATIVEFTEKIIKLKF
jgi:hypothetical protein